MIRTLMECYSPCLDLKAWLLFRELITRLPILNITRLLKAHSFLGILQKTLKWLREDVEACPDSPSSLLEESTGAESSSATVENPSQTPRETRKRKRDGSHPLSSHIHHGNSPSFSYICRSICLTIDQLQSLTKELSDGSRGYATEHMKNALKALPEEAANILGDVVVLVNRALDTTTTHQQSPNPSLVMECLPPAVNLWGNRSSAGSSPSDDVCTIDLNSPTTLTDVSLSSQPNV